MQPDPGLYAVHDPDDAFEHARFLRELSNREDRCLFVPITPGGNNHRFVGADILKALGKDPDFNGFGRNGTETWLRAALWLEVSGIEELFISRAHLLSNSLLEQLVGLAYRAGARLWLIFQSSAFRSEHERFLGNWPVARMAFDQFAPSWSKRRNKGVDAKRAVRRPASSARLPEVPIDDFTSFRASCRQLLDENSFERVDAEFMSSFRHTQSDLAGDENATEMSICAHVRELIADCDWMPEVLTRVRGSQVAAFHAGFLMKVNLDVLCGTTVARVRLDGEVIGLLERYSVPRFAALAVLAVATGHGFGDLRAVDLGDVSEDGQRVCVAGRSYRLPPRAAVSVAALVRERLLQSARATDPLFVYVQGTGRRHGTLRRWTVRGMSETLKKMGRETGLLMTSHLGDTGNRDAVAWSRRRGISLQRI